jgi:YidC/Oxa1 family membrane protein insertase
MWYYICLPFAALLRLFYNLTGSYGVSLILFTLVIKLILLPFQMKSKKSMVRMSRMSSKTQEIQKKYANNQAKMNEEIQKLYQEEGVNPMSGCVWSLLPMPILFALYYIIREPVVYFMNFGTKAAAMEVLSSAKDVMTSLGLTWTTLKNGADGAYAQIEIINALQSHADSSAVQSFFAANPNWINVKYQFLNMDLSKLPWDALKNIGAGLSVGAIALILVPILSGVLSLLLSKVTMTGQPNTAATAASNRMMLLMMPLMSAYFGFILPAALGIYWIAQSAFSIVQEYLLGKFYNGKLETEEDERQKTIDADRRRRQDEARVRQEQQRQLTAKQQAAARKKAAQEAAKNRGKKSSTTEAGRLGERPYARGRGFSEDHYKSEEQEK